MTTEATITVYHGTSADYDGYPESRTDVYGIRGVFTTESQSDAEYFATEATNEGDHFGEPRVFRGVVSLDDVEDLTGMDDQEAILEAAAESVAQVIILPDMSGVSEREIVIRSSFAIDWQETILVG